MVTPISSIRSQLQYHCIREVTRNLNLKTFICFCHSFLAPCLFPAWHFSQFITLHCFTNLFVKCLAPLLQAPWGQGHVSFNQTLFWHQEVLVRIRKGIHSCSFDRAYFSRYNLVPQVLDQILTPKDSSFCLLSELIKYNFLLLGNIQLSSSPDSIVPSRLKALVVFFP